jgi:hypothetical protein
VICHDRDRVLVEELPEVTVAVEPRLVLHAAVVRMCFMLMVRCVVSLHMRTLSRKECTISDCTSCHGSMGMSRTSIVSFLIVEV